MRRGFYLFLVGIDVCVWLMIVGILLALTFSGAHAEFANQGGMWHVSVKLTVHGHTTELFSRTHFGNHQSCDDWMASDEVKEQMSALLTEAQAVDTEATLLSSCVPKGLHS